MATSKYEWLKSNETSDTDLVQHLPSEIWFHIFEYLEFDQAKKIILKLNCQLAYQFLNDENELLYRYLSKWIMKRELESCIAEINGRIIANRDYYDEFIIAHTLPHTPKKSFTCHPKSMSQLRSCLKKKGQRVMNLFPDLYLEKLEDIQQAWIESFSGKLPLKLKPALLQQDPPSDDNFDPKQVEQDDETTNNDHVHKLFPLKFKSGSQRKLKWKSIWNGVNSEYYKSQAISNIESLIQSGTRKIRRITFMAHRKMSLKFSETLEHIYYFLTHMPTKERHEIMFNTRTFTLKTSYDSTRPYLNSDTFSSICYVAYLNQFNTTPFANALEKVIFLFLEECKTYHGDTKQILMHEWIPNNCSLALLLRWSNFEFDHARIRIIREYAHDIRTSSPKLLAYMFVTLVSRKVSLEIIYELFKMDIITTTVISTPIRDNSTLNIPKYLIAIANRQMKNQTNCCYFVDVFNMVIQRLNNTPFAAQLSKTKAQPLQLNLFVRPNNIVFRSLLQGYNIPPDRKHNEQRNMFFKHLRKILGQKSASNTVNDNDIYDDEFEPLEYYGSFDKPKFFYH